MIRISAWDGSPSGSYDGRWVPLRALHPTLMGGPPFGQQAGRSRSMAALDAVSLTIMFAALLVLAGILSSLVALRFGAPLLLVFLLVGMLAGESGPGGIKFDDVRTTYLVGAVALALILFDGGLHTRLGTFRSALLPSLVLATI